MKKMTIKANKSGMVPGCTIIYMICIRYQIHKKDHACTIPVWLDAKGIFYIHFIPEKNKKITATARSLVEVRNQFHKNFEEYERLAR